MLDNEIPLPSVKSARGEHLVFHQAGLGPPMNLESMHVQLDDLTEFTHVFFFHLLLMFALQRADILTYCLWFIMMI